MGKVDTARVRKSINALALELHGEVWDAASPDLFALCDALDAAEKERDEARRAGIDDAELIRDLRREHDDQLKVYNDKLRQLELIATEEVETQQTLRAEVERLRAVAEAAESLFAHRPILLRPNKKWDGAVRRFATVLAALKKGGEVTPPRSAREIATEVLRRFESYVVDGKQIETRGDPTDEELAIAAAGFAEGQRAALEWMLDQGVDDYSHDNIRARLAELETRKG